MRLTKIKAYSYYCVNYMDNGQLISMNIIYSPIWKIPIAGKVYINQNTSYLSFVNRHYCNLFCIFREFVFV